MRYLKPFIKPNEMVLFDGQVHPIIFLKGFTLLIVSWWGFVYLTHLPPHNGAILWTGYYLSEYTGLGFFYDGFWYLHHLIREYETVVKILSVGLGIWGLRSLLWRAVVFFCTEIVVTDMRILVKRGWFNVVTEEIDRARIAGVTVFQPIWGRVFNYGWVNIQGFVQNVYGLPPLMKPYLLQQKLGITGATNEAM